MKRRLINISTYIPLARVRERERDKDKGRKRERERETRRGKERKRGNTREEFSCSLTPILGFMLGKEACMNTHALAHIHASIPLIPTKHTEEKPSYKMFTYKYCTAHRHAYHHVQSTGKKKICLCFFSLKLPVLLS